MHDAEKTLLEGRTFLTSGGTETYLLFRMGFPLRENCAFEVFDDATAWAELEGEYLFPILSAARSHGHGLLLDALVWRAHSDYVGALGYPEEDVARFNKLAVASIRRAERTWCGRDPGHGDPPVLTAADIGPRGDGYKVADAAVTPEAAHEYHRRQMQWVAQAEVDVVCGLTMTSVNESIGVVRAARESGLPVLISPTVETDGTLPDGTGLGDFIRRVDEATAGAPLFYMVNCAHPSHLRPTLERAKASNADWLARFRGFRANSSRKSHAELDECSELDRGNPGELARELAEMQRAYDLAVVGGCCGTDAEHLEALAAALPPRR